MSINGIHVKDIGNVRYLTIDRVEHANAVRGEDLIALTQAIESAQSQPDIRALLVTGRGDKFFCCGSDIEELSGGVPDIGTHLAKWHALIDCIAASEKPVVAAVNGSAIGGGLEIVLACHLSLAVDSAKVGLPELKVGLFPAAGGVRKLTRRVGVARALDLILGAKILRADDAVAFGLLNRAVTAEHFPDTLRELLEGLCALETNAVSAVVACAYATVMGTDSNQLEVDLLRNCYENPKNRALLESFLTRPKAPRN